MKKLPIPAVITLISLYLLTLFVVSWWLLGEPVRDPLLLMGTSGTWAFGAILALIGFPFAGMLAHFAGLKKPQLLITWAAATTMILISLAIIGSLTVWGITAAVVIVSLPSFFFGQWTGGRIKIT